MLRRIRQDFLSVVNLSSSMKIVDPINASSSQYEYGTGYSTSFEIEGYRVACCDLRVARYS